jgi:chaperonin GroES
MSTIKPMFDRVLVKRVETVTTSPGGIIIPETAQDKTQSGHVVAVGTGKLLPDGQLRPLSVKPGSKVLFGKYSGTEINVDGQDLVILREDELLGEFCDTQAQTSC